MKKDIEKTLESLDGMERATPQPYFYTRVRARLEKHHETKWETTGSFLARPIVVACGLCVVLVFNAFMLFRQDAPVNRSVNNSVAAYNELNTDNEYVLATNSSFDYENLDQQ